MRSMDRNRTHSVMCFPYIWSVFQPFFCRSSCLAFIRQLAIFVSPLINLNQIQNTVALTSFVMYRVVYVHETLFLITSSFIIIERERCADPSSRPVQSLFGFWVAFVSSKSAQRKARDPDVLGEVGPLASPLRHRCGDGLVHVLSFGCCHLIGTDSGVHLHVWLITEHRRLVLISYCALMQDLQVLIIVVKVHPLPQTWNKIRSFQLGLC